MNKVVLIGNVGKEPRSGQTTNGKDYCNFSLATKEYKGETEWHNITCWGKTAEIATRYVNKGSKVAVEGRLQTREYTNNDGQQMRTTSVVVDRLELLDSKPAGNEQQNAPEKPQKPAQDDIPF